MATAALGSVLTTFRDSLAARPGLSGVDVSLVLTDAGQRADRIVLMRGDELRRLGEWAAVGSSRFEDVLELPALVGGYSTGTVADTAAATALDRVDEIIDEIFDELATSPPTVGDQTVNAIVSDRDYRLTVPDRGGWLAICELTITLTGRGST
jgi:hypothetical protein